MAPPVATRLHSHRRKSGLTQRQVANIVGLASDVQISRHETEAAIPPVLIAVAYEILFQSPIAEMFPGLYEAVRENVERGLAELEEQLQQSTVKGRAAEIIAHKLEWICMRKALRSIDC